MTEFEYTTGNLTVTVILDFYEVEKWHPSEGKQSSVRVYYVEDVIHKGESIGALISEETADDLMDYYKEEVKKHDF